jgi:hypothetical protein
MGSLLLVATPGASGIAAPFGWSKPTTTPGPAGPTIGTTAGTPSGALFGAPNGVFPEIS